MLHIQKMAKRFSEGTKSTEVKQIKRIGRLSYSRQDQLGRGSFGTVFKGKFKESEEKAEIDVAIKRVENIDVNEIEKVIIEQLEAHPNVLQYYCTEEDEDFVLV